MQLNDLTFADGKITKIELTVQSLELTFADWTDEHWRISFANHLGLELSGCLGDDLSELIIAHADVFKTLVSGRHHDENSETFLCYNFIGAWNGLPVLKIIADGQVKVVRLPK